MRQSQLFTKTRKDAPSEEVSKNAQLLIRAGYIDKLMAGVYTYLPLGLRVLNNIEQIIREEINKADGQEILMPAMQPKENWLATGRWETLDVLYKVKDSEGREVALGPTHEEVVVPLAKQFISSYKDLPFAAYQFQDKFRMEKRAKSGILRGREFKMKDLYSFHADEADLKMYYDIIKNAYTQIFKRVGIGHKTYVTYASGGSFSKYSHEFQTVTPAGEDLIYICDRCSLAINKEIKAEHSKCPECGAETFKEEKAIEVGNIFELKTKYSEPFDLKYKNEKGESVPVIMGCYGIGLGRVMGAVVEALADDKGIVWPESIAPFKVHLVALAGKDGKVVTEAAEKLYGEMRNTGIQVLYDDREVSAGNKFADSDLMGIPYRVVVSEKTLAAGEVELKIRQTGAVSMLKMDQAATTLDDWQE
jgi:prolyl-tRNA synthetase